MCRVVGGEQRTRETEANSSRRQNDTGSDERINYGHRATHEHREASAARLYSTGESCASWPCSAHFLRNLQMVQFGKTSRVSYRVTVLADKSRPVHYGPGSRLILRLNE